jgi:hypothetical protein
MIMQAATTTCYVFQAEGAHMNTNLKIGRFIELDRSRKSGSE